MLLVGAPIPLCPPDLPNCDLNPVEDETWIVVAFIVVIIVGALCWYYRRQRQ